MMTKWVTVLTILFFKGNYYGTPKPPAEPNVVQPDLVDQVLFEEEFGTEVQRKRTTSVSKMDRKDSVVPEEEDEEERPALPNGLPGEDTALCVCVCAFLKYNWYIIWCLAFSHSANTERVWALMSHKISIKVFSIIELCLEAAVTPEILVAFKLLS